MLQYKTGSGELNGEDSTRRGKRRDEKRNQIGERAANNLKLTGTAKVNRTKRSPGVIKIRPLPWQPPGKHGSRPDETLSALTSIPTKIL